VEEEFRSKPRDSKKTLLPGEKTFFKRISKFSCQLNTIFLISRCLDVWESFLTPLPAAKKR
jgi:hypothetical protein